MSRILCRGVCCSFCVILLFSLSCTDYWKTLLEHRTWLPLFVFVFFSRLSFVFFVFVSPTWWEEVARLVAARGDRAQGEILAEGHRHTVGGCLSISFKNLNFNQKLEILADRHRYTENSRFSHFQSDYVYCPSGDHQLNQMHTVQISYILKFVGIALLV